MHEFHSPPTRVYRITNFPNIADENTVTNVFYLINTGVYLMIKRSFTFGISDICFHFYVFFTLFEYQTSMNFVFLSFVQLCNKCNFLFLFIGNKVIQSLVKEMYAEAMNKVNTRLDFTHIDYNHLIESIIYAVVISGFTMIIIYFDSDIPGISPPTPFSPRKANL